MGLTSKYVIRNANAYTDQGFTVADLMVENGKVTKIQKSLPLPSEEISIINAMGCVAFPSFVDMHVHFREPGFSYKETIKSGTESAAAGGFTSVCTMPNLNPVPDSIPHLNQQLHIIDRDAVINVIPFASITKGRMGKELVDYKELAPYVAGFSDDGSGVQSMEVMKAAMSAIAETGKILSAHCEVEDLLEGGYIHAGDYAKKHRHKGICSASEWKEVERNIKLSEETGCRLHIDHVSTKETVELVRKAKKKGVRVTCETAPHYLFFDDSDLQEDGRFKMNPPIRGIEDREALRKGLADGTIDVIATDHAPHSVDEKNKGLEKSAMGVVGLETSFSAVYTSMVKSGLISLEHLIKVMSENPRKILGLEGKGYIHEGMKADLVLVKLDEDMVVAPQEFKTKGRSTPFSGMILNGKIKMTIYNGYPVYNIL